jgi:hypothetical protein
LFCSVLLLFCSLLGSIHREETCKIPFGIINQSIVCPWL